MQIQAFKSTYTGQLFETQQELDDHNKVQEELKQRIQSAKELKERTNEILNEPRLTATSLEDFRQKMVEALKLLTENESTKVLNIEFTRTHFGNIRITHSSPIGTPTAWGTNKTAAGWGGQVRIIYNEDASLFCKARNLVSMFPGFHSGTGGFSGSDYNGIKAYCLSYDLSLFLDDFPLIKEKHERYTELSQKAQERHQRLLKEAEDAILTDTVYQEAQIKVDELKKKLDNLQLLMKEVYKTMGDIRDSYNKQVWMDNPFEKQEEFYQLQNLF